MKTNPFEQFLASVECPRCGRLWLLEVQRRQVTAAQRDALHALAAARGMTWSELCRALADGELTLTE